MFTGIIESIGNIVEIIQKNNNYHFKIQSSIGKKLHTDQSVSHDGICLTVTKVIENCHWVTVVAETKNKTTVADWQLDKKLNLERCMKIKDRFDGHIVQGHVDTVATVQNIEALAGSWIFTFTIDNTHLLVEKGSVCINGVSLTCFEVGDSSFKVAIIPYTYQHTNFPFLHKNDKVNIEFDIIGKYIQKWVKN